MTPADRAATPRPAERAPEAALDPVDETSLDSFPASDPPSWTGMQAGRPDRSLGAAAGSPAAPRP